MFVSQLPLPPFTNTHNHAADDDMTDVELFSDSQPPHQQQQQQQSGLTAGCVAAAAASCCPGCLQAAIASQLLYLAFINSGGRAQALDTCFGVRHAWLLPTTSHAHHALTQITTATLTPLSCFPSRLYPPFPKSMHTCPHVHRSARPHSLSTGPVLPAPALSSSHLRRAGLGQTHGASTAAAAGAAATRTTPATHTRCAGGGSSGSSSGVRGPGGGGCSTAAA